jgi:ACR3 family arsenite efflux pump ArsB
MFNEMPNQKSVLLISMFVSWVLSPFIALLLANASLRVANNRLRMTLYLLILSITIGSLFIYSGGWNLSGTKPAFKFLMVPLISWLLILFFVAIPAMQAGKRSQKNR